MFEVFTKWYLWYFIYLTIMSFLYVYNKDKYLASDEGKQLKNEDDYKVGFVFAILVFLPLILVSGFRGWDIDL